MKKLTPVDVCLTVWTLACGAILGVAPSFAVAAYPERAITLVIPYSPGGASDYLARLVAEPLSKKLGQPVLVENKPGAATAIGTTDVIKSRPDGYRLLFGTSSTLAEAITKKDPAFNALEDLTPVIKVAEIYQVILASKNSGVTNLQQLKDYSKTKGIPIKYGTAGVLSTTHLWTAQFLAKAGIQGLHIPYKGNSDALLALIAGDIDIMFNDVATSIPGALSNQFTMMAVTSSQRHPLIPDVPTVAELGSKETARASMFGIFAPKNTPPEVVETLTKALHEVFQDPNLKAKFDERGTVLGTSTNRTFGEDILLESDDWKKVMADAHLEKE